MLVRPLLCFSPPSSNNELNSLFRANSLLFRGGFLLISVVLLLIGAIPIIG